MKHLSGIKPFSKAKRFFNPVVSELKSELAFGLLYSNPNLVRTSNYVNCVRPFTCTDLQTSAPSAINIKNSICGLYVITMLIAVPTWPFILVCDLKRKTERVVCMTSMQLFHNICVHYKWKRYLRENVLNWLAL